MNAWDFVKRMGGRYSKNQDDPWTAEDWSDFYHAIDSAMTKIARRHGWKEDPTGPHANASAVMHAPEMPRLHMKPDQILHAINDATKRLPWFPGLEIKPYQRRMMELLESVPEGYKPEFYRGRRRWDTIAKCAGKPTLLFKDGEWKQISPSSPPTGSPSAQPPAVA